MMRTVTASGRCGSCLSFLSGSLATKTRGPLYPPLSSNFLTYLKCSLVTGHRWGHLISVP
jgi:hypothetical protein